MWHERHLPPCEPVWKTKYMSLNKKINVRCTAERALVGIVAGFLALAIAAGQAGAQGALSYPYLDGSEAGFPAFRRVAERAARG